MSVDQRQLGALFRIIARLSLDELMRGRPRAMLSMGSFYLRGLPALLRAPELAYYLDGSGGPKLGQRHPHSRENAPISSSVSRVLPD